jgi:Fe-S oxidoreductase
MFYLRQYSMKGPMDRILRRKIAIDEPFGKAMFQCTGCGACEAICHADIPLNGWLDDVKEMVVEAHAGPLPAHRQLVESVRKTKNVYGRSNEKRLAWAGDDLKQSPNPEVVYWIGCVTSFQKQELARATLKILNAANVRYRVLGKDEWCTGSPLIRVGEAKYVKDQLMPHNIEAVAGTGAKLLVTGCGECFRTFSVDYRRYGSNPPFQVLHISHFVERLVKEKRVKFAKPVKRKLAYHDPCHLGRNGGAFDEPRRVFKFIRGVELVEMFYNRERSRCCGEDLGFRAAFPAEASMLAQRRLEEAKDTGAEALVTADPHTEVHLAEVGEKRGRGVPILDMVEVLVEAL